VVQDTADRFACLVTGAFGREILEMRKQQLSAVVALDGLSDLKKRNTQTSSKFLKNAFQPQLILPLMDSISKKK
jgi:hypothetical protein